MDMKCNSPRTVRNPQLLEREQDAPQYGKPGRPLLRYC